MCYSQPLLYLTKLTGSSLTLSNRLCPSLARYHSASVAVARFHSAERQPSDEILILSASSSNVWKTKQEACLLEGMQAAGSERHGLHPFHGSTAVCMCPKRSAPPGLFIGSHRTVFVRGTFPAHQNCLSALLNGTLTFFCLFDTETVLLSPSFFLLSWPCLRTRIADKAFYKQPNSDVIGFV